jgi:predicted RNA-binding protein
MMKIGILDGQGGGIGSAIIKRLREELAEQWKSFFGNQEELILASVDLLEPENGYSRLVNIFGEQKILSAKVKQLSLVNHKIIREEK